MVANASMATVPLRAGRTLNALRAHANRASVPGELPCSEQPPIYRSSEHCCTFFEPATGYRFVPQYESIEHLSHLSQEDSLNQDFGAGLGAHATLFG